MKKETKMNNDLLRLLAMLSAVDTDIEKFVSELIKNSSTYDLITFLNSGQLNEYVRTLGLDAIATEYYNNLNSIMDKQLALYAPQIKEFNETAIKGALGMLVDTNIKTLNNSVSNNIDIVNKVLTESILGGDDFQISVQKMKDSGMTNNQRIETLLHTGYYNFSRVTTRMAFKSKPTQRFEYAGGTIPTSSDECRWLFLNQDPKGYTMDEIEKGIETPYKYTYGINKGKVKKIYWSGRHPNFNCIHEWLPKDLAS